MSKKHTILIVNLPGGVQRFLQARWGDRCDFIAAQTAMDVGRLINDKRPDAILTDVAVPGVSAAELMRSLHTDPVTEELPVAVFSRSLDDQVFDECRCAGASLVVTPATARSQVVEWLDGLVGVREESCDLPTLNSDMATSITTATHDVVGALLGIEAEFGDLRVEMVKPRSAGVIGSISVAGFVTGGITVFLSMALASKIAEWMLEDLSPSDEDIVDAVGEMTNMIAGNIKTCLCREEELFSMSPPSVTLGRELRRISLARNLAFVLPCSLQGEEMLVEFNLVPRRPKGEQSPVAVDETGDHHTIEPTGSKCTN